MTSPPSRSAMFGSPDHATQKTLIQQLYDYVVERLGGTAATASGAEQDTACTALGAVRKTGDTMGGNLNVPSLNAGQLAGMRNLLINGGMEINLRGLTSVADDAYCLDRWYVLTETGNVTVAQQVDQENGTPFNARLTQPDATAKQVALAQIVEATASKRMRGKSATLSARIRCSAAVPINYAVLEWTGTADTVTSDVISAWAAAPSYVGGITERAKGSVSPAAGAWTDAPGLSAAINGSTNNLIVLFWSNGDLAQGVTLDIARVQLEPGTVATPFEFAPLSVVQSMCKRYCRTGTIDVGGAVGLKYANGAGANFFNSGHTFDTEMRSGPTIGISGSITYENCSAISFVSGADGFSTRVTVSAAGTYRAYAATWLATAEL